MFRSKWFFLAALLLPLLLCRCANPMAPEGGIKDVVPPKVLSCDPPAYSINFHKKEIKITFNKYIQLKDQSNQVNIVPQLVSHADFRLHGKSIFVKLPDTLKSNTTYAIHFGEAIADITEGNVLHDYTYVFSTGSYIDSLSLSGKVLTAFDLVPQKDVIAMLYINENDTLPLDSLPLHVKPYYYTKTNDNGEFHFTNLRDVPFLLFALKDLNNNYIFDQARENVAFCDSLIKGVYIKPLPPENRKKDSLSKRDTSVIIKDTLSKRDTSVLKKDTGKLNKQMVPVYTLMLFEEFDSTQKILKADMVNDYQVGIYFRHPSIKPEFIPLNIPDTAGWMIPEFNARRDSVFLWMKNTGKDSLYLRLADNGKTLDTVGIDLRKKTPRKRKADKGVAKQAKLGFTTNMPDGRFNQFRNDPVIIFAYPLSGYDLSRILLVDGKDTVRPKLAFTDSVKRKLRVFHKWKEDHPYRLILPDSIFRSMNGNSNDSVIFSFRSHSLRDFGSIQMTLSIKDPSGDYLIQLLDEKENVLEQYVISAPGKVKFDYLAPAKYKIKVIYDRNRNGRWDSGKFSRKIQPEKVQYYPKTIEVRANWDIDESWDL